MALIQHFFDSWTPRALAALRLVTGYLYLQHGTAKLLHVPHLATFDQLPVLSLIGFAGMLEIIGSLLILVGLLTRPVAFILSGEMAVAYFTVHARQGNFFMPQLNQGEVAVLYCFIFLFLATAGGGTWSIDALLGRRKTENKTFRHVALQQCARMVRWPTGLFGLCAVPTNRLAHPATTRAKRERTQQSVDGVRETERLPWFVRQRAASSTRAPSENTKLRDTSPEI